MSNARRIETEAAEWLARRTDRHWSEDDQAELDEWLSQGFAYKSAYWRLEEGWDRAGRMAALGHRASGRGTAGDRRWVQGVLAASLALAVFTGLRFSGWAGVEPQPRGQLISTVVGGHKIVPLEDGSRIELNTATLVHAAVSSQKREVWLEQGEAYFEVLHSAAKPFVVHAGTKTVTVLGTKFSVRREGDQVTVAVASGRVRVADAKAPESSTAAFVAAGSVAVTRPDATLVTKSSPRNVEADLAWRNGQLIFRNDSLAQAAAEFNRYNDRRILVSGPAAELKISGSFKSRNVDGFARLLRDAYGLNVSIEESRVRVAG